MNNRIILGDCVAEMKKEPNRSVDLVFADPPFDIGKVYDKYDDSIGRAAYAEWTGAWLDQAFRVLKPNGSIWVAIGDERLAEVMTELNKRGHYRNNVCWYYTFGENAKNKFNRCHTNLLYYTKSPTDFTFNTEAIKVPSARQWKYKDKRAKSGGKLPDDVWEVPAHDWIKELIRRAELGDGSDPTLCSTMSLNVLDQLVDQIICAFIGDMWKVSRVCGTFKERIKGPDGSSHPCQMSSNVLRRIIKASSNEGDCILDPFCGTGTTVAVAQELKRKWLTYEISEQYCRIAAERLFGDPTLFLKGD